MDDTRMPTDTARTAAPPPLPTPLELAREIAAGNMPDDAVIARWRTRAPELWAVACDDEYRAQLLRGAGQPAAREQQRQPVRPLARLASGAATSLAAGFRRLETILMAPVIPQLDARGNFVGARRELPAELDAQPEPVAPPPVAAAAAPRTAEPAKKTDWRESRQPAQLRHIGMLHAVVMRHQAEVGEALAEVARQLDEIRTASSTAPQMRAGRMLYCGAWRADETYAAGEYVSHDGGMWLCLAPATGVRPGRADAATYWRLVVKSGEVPR